jgi:uncharacterized repeat protein (TIGR01451 family)
MIEFKSPFTLKASNIKSASLTARLRMYDETPHHYNLTVVNGTGDNLGTVTLTYSGAIAGGVYRLKLTAADGCCCYSGLVYTPGCPPVSTPSTHTGDGGVIEPVASGCCDLTMTKTMTPESVSVGATITTTIAITNTGSATQTAVKVVDVVPAALGQHSAVSGTVAGTVAQLAAGLVVGDILPGATATLTFTSVALTAGTLTNTATAGCASAQDTVVIASIVAEPTLTINADHTFLVISPSMPKIGDTGTVRVTVTNTGTTAYTGNVVINNPAGFTLTGPTITGSLAAGQTKEWLWQATINAAGTHTTTATANGVSDSYSTVATA